MHLLLARAALLSPLKRPRPDAAVPDVRLTVPGVRVDLARLAAYERVCGFATGAEAMPVTYPQVLAFPLTMRVMARRAFPLPVLGLVHTSVEITRWCALPATGEYELSVRVEGLAPHRRGTEATVVTGARLGGGLVWESRSTYLARHSTTAAGAPDSRQADGAAPPTPPAPSAHSTPSTHSAPPTHSTPSAPLPAVAEWRLAKDVGRRYGAVSGDRNPIHLYPLTARLFGYARPIAHGMWTVARCLAEHPAGGEPLTVRADFKAPVLLPATVTYAAEGGRFELRGAEGEARPAPHLTGEVQPALG
ncbi:MaoC family dehydratase [Streptomyces sp. NPDC050535]|uniref:MaoC family dehydratase n=1 Tax=Streptomyces sp. NPDC050535 TaxID=3365626 RepID=UPI003794D78C